MSDHSKNTSAKTRRMEQRSAWQSAMWIWISGVLLAGLLLVSACAMGPEQTADPAQGSVVTPPPRVSHRDAVFVQISPDVTGSYPKGLLQAFLKQMATWVETLPRVNSDQATVYVTYLNHAPYLPASSPLTFTVSSVPNWPELQQTPVPSCPNNPYACSNAQATVTTDNATHMHAYQQQLQEVQGQLSGVQQITTQEAQKLAQLHPAVDDQGTSVWGVLNLASQRFSGVTGQKWLVIASDLANNSTLDQVAPDLSGVHVLVMDLFCTSAVECQQTKTRWRAIFSRAHALSISFLEPAESQTAPSPWE